MELVPAVPRQDPGYVLVRLLVHQRANTDTKKPFTLTFTPTADVESAVTWMSLDCGRKHAAQTHASAG